jgi:hypothetical protein
MTEGEMNGERPLLMSIGDRNKSRLLLGVQMGALGAILSLGACASVAPGAPPATEASPAAVHVDEVANANLPYPRWSQFPAVPENVPTLAEFARRVNQLESEHGAFLSEAHRLRWTLRGTETWARQARAEIDPRYARPAPANSVAETEAYARAMRALAAPPPPAK